MKKRIVFCAEKVFKNLGLGHRENIYCRALESVLRAYFTKMRTEVCCPFFYHDEVIGHGRADFVINNSIIEVKSVKKVSEEHFHQLKKYIQSLNRVEHRKYSGFILNFNQKTRCVEIHQSVVKSRFFEKATKKK
jgi:GxxExxY protein